MRWYVWLYDITDGSVIGELTPLMTGASFSKVHKETGAGEVALDMDLPGFDDFADALATENIVGFTKVDDPSEPVFAFLHEDEVIERVNDSMKREYPISGRGALAVLEWGAILAPGYPNPTADRWKWTQRHYMHAWLDTKEAADARGAGSALVVPTFTRYLDSVGSGWTDRADIEEGVGGEGGVLQFFTKCAEGAGFIDWTWRYIPASNTIELNAYKDAIGNDVSDDVVFSIGGTQITQKIQRTRRQIANVVYTTTATPGLVGSAADNTSIAAWRRREKVVQADGALNKSTADKLAQLFIEQRKDQGVSFELSVVEDEGTTFPEDFDICDTVGVDTDIPGVDTEYKLIGATVTIDEDGQGELEVTISSMMDLRLEALQRQFNELAKTPPAVVAVDPDGNVIISPPDPGYDPDPYDPDPVNTGMVDEYDEVLALDSEYGSGANPSDPSGGQNGYHVDVPGPVDNETEDPNGTVSQTTPQGRTSLQGKTLSFIDREGAGEGQGVTVGQISWDKTLGMTIEALLGVLGIVAPHVYMSLGEDITGSGADTGKFVKFYYKTVDDGVELWAGVFDQGDLETALYESKVGGGGGGGFGEPLEGPDASYTNWLGNDHYVRVGIGPDYTIMWRAFQDWYDWCDDLRVIQSYRLKIMAGGAAYDGGGDWGDGGAPEYTGCEMEFDAPGGGYAYFGYNNGDYDGFYEIDFYSNYWTWDATYTDDGYGYFTIRAGDSSNGGEILIDAGDPDEGYGLINLRAYEVLVNGKGIATYFVHTWGQPGALDSGTSTRWRPPASINAWRVEVLLSVSNDTSFDVIFHLGGTDVTVTVGSGVSEASTDCDVNLTYTSDCTVEVDFTGAGAEGASYLIRYSYL